MHLEAHYLIPDSIASLGHLVKTHPLAGILSLLALFAVVLEVMRRIFGRLAFDIIMFALIVYAILLLTGSSLYTLTHVPGFRFGG